MMKMMARLMLLPACALLLLALGCTSPDATATQVPQPTPTATPVPTATPEPSPVSSSATPGVIPTPTTEAALPTELFLEIIGPDDGSEVAQATVVVQGRTTPDAVVSIGDEAIGVDALGEFAVQVLLEMGPNIIEVVASNVAGEHQSTVLSLFYTP